ncbi:papain-like cysteine protease family protein [Streptomyces mashuensis]|nr:papain-like cysteine protease family protein [Streptomyces mashuensis]
MAAATGTAQAAAYDDITMQKQEKTQWCWDASGNTIAAWWGYSYTQTQFCDLAHSATGVSCANQPATLGDMAGAWQKMGFSNTGTGVSSALSFNDISTEVNASRPMGVRIGWNSGGGHMNVIYGFDERNNTIGVGDPWPDTQTYTWWNYNDYVSNGSFKWTHSRYRIQG